jgi:hypothetical protein
MKKKLLSLLVALVMTVGLSGTALAAQEYGLVYDATELYGFIAHDGSTTYVWDRAARTITFTTRGKEYVVKYLVPGSHQYHGLTKDEAIVKVPEGGFGMFYDMGYTEKRVEGYTDTTTGFGRHYVWAREWALCLEKM